MTEAFGFTEGEVNVAAEVAVLVKSIPTSITAAPSFTIVSGDKFRTADGYDEDVSLPCDLREDSLFLSDRSLP